MPHRILRTQPILLAPSTIVLAAEERPGRAYCVIQCDPDSAVPVGVSWRWSQEAVAGGVILQAGEIALLNGRDDEGKVNGDMPWFGAIEVTGIGGTATVRGIDVWWSD